MNDLIQITQQDDCQLVDGRNLHEILEVQTPFHKWIKRRVEDYEFVENEDFTTMDKNVRGAIQTDYALTLDMAKELAMLEKSDKGRKIRKYFIQKEKELRQTHNSLGINVELETRVLNQQKEQLTKKLKVVNSELSALANMPVKCGTCQRICKNKHALHAHKCHPNQSKLFA